jgi:TP901 family phage tail tape measure protein
MAEKKQVLRIDVKGTPELIQLRTEIVKYEKSLKKLKAEVKDTRATEGQIKGLSALETKLKSTRKQYRDVQKSLTDVNTTTKKGIGFVGKMAGAFAAANIATAAFTAASRALKNAIKDGIVTFKDFEFQMAKVKAISGASDKEFKKLQDSAQELGRTTFFTASQVGELQLNLSKLGFRPEEILQSQEAILQLSTAMGEDLGRTATVVAATLRGFGESTEETARFADGMAAAFSNSALDIEKFQTSMSKVSAIAAMAGFSFEETTGLLALLTNSGMEASIAGTSLRNILLHLQDPTSDLSERLGRTVHSGEDLIIALKELSDSGIDVAGVMEIVDRRQVQAMNSFIAGADTLTEFNQILNSSSGAAEDMADVMEDTLGGALLKLKSAYEGLQLALLEGNGIMQDFVEGVAGYFNNLADKFTAADTRAQRFVNTTVKDLKKEFGELSKSEEDFEGTLSGMMAHRRGRMEDRLQDTKEDLKLFLEQNSKFAIARDKDLIAEQKALEEEIQIKEIAVQKMAEAINTQIEKEKEAADKFEENEKKRLELLAAEAEANSSLIKIQEDKLEQAKKLPETTEAEISSKNRLIQSINTEIKRLKELGVEKDKQKMDFGVPETGGIGEGFDAAVKSRMAELDAQIKEQEAQLMQDYVDGRIASEAELNEAIFNMKIATYDAERNLINQTSIAHDAAGNAMIAMEGQKKIAAEKTAEANKKQGEQLIENAIMGAQSVNQAFASVLTVKINEILLNALASMFADKTIPFVAKLALGVGMKSVITPMINSILGVGSGGGGGASVSGGGEAITFANGGLTQGGMFKGPSHANGGVKFAVGGRIHEAEGGEAIINKRSTAAFRPILSAINSYNGNGVKFAEGGLLSTGEKFAMGGELRSVQSMISGGGTQRVVLVESDVTSTQNRISALEARASF